MELINRLEDSENCDFNSILEQSVDSKIDDCFRDDEISKSELKNEKKLDYNFKNEKNINFFSNLNKIKTFDEKTLEEKMEDIYEEFKSDTTITVSNIRDIAFRTAAIKGRWCSRLMSERIRQKRLKEALDKLTAELGAIVDKKMKSVSYLGAKQGRDNMINSNEEVKSLNRQIYESKQLQDYLAMINDSIKDLGYIVKNSLDALNLERGL